MKRKKKRREREREREKRERKKERVRESHGSTHSSSSCTQAIKRLPLFLSKPLQLHSDWHLLTCTKGAVPCVPNHKALCQWIMPWMNMVPIHEAWARHAITIAIPSHPFYMLAVSLLGGAKVRFTNPLPMFISQMNSACKIMLPLFLFFCSGLGVFLRYFHRLFKLSMVLRLNSLL